jgi:2-dehydropantoate 2-reductase
MRILVYGLGALGSAFAGFLKKAGHEVYAIGRERLIKPIREKGLKITGIWGEHLVELKEVYPSIEQLPVRDFDLVILTVKSYDTEKALGDLKKVNFKYLLLAQNGYGNYEKAIEVFGREKVILARVIFGATIPEPGEMKITVIADDVVIGNPDGAIDEGELKRLAKVINDAGIPTRHSPDVYKYLLDKILYNSALNPLGALLETNYGTLAELPETRELMDGIIDEIFAVARAKGIELFHRSADEYKKLFYEKLIPPTAEHYPSMYWDIKAGKRTEIDALNGAIVGLGKEAGVPTPVNEVITKLVKAKEKLNLKS